MSDLKVGDELAFDFGRGSVHDWKIIKINKITPSGRIKCGDYELNPDLTLRGRVPTWPWRAELPTEEIRNYQRKLDELRRLQWRLVDQYGRLKPISYGKVKKIHAILDEE